MDKRHICCRPIMAILVCGIVGSMLLASVHGLGYDSASSCNPKMSRRGRAQLIASIPCDLSVQPYCNLPGSSYPWHAVRRFVHENQGLMRRMYGDVKHIAVLRSEIDNNDIELEDIERAAERYGRSGGQKKVKFLYGDLVSSRTNEVLSEPYFRPTSTSTTASPSKDVPSTGVQDVNNSMPTGLEDLHFDIASDPSVETNTVQNATVPAALSIANTKFDFELTNTSSAESAATISTTLKLFLPPKVIALAALSTTPKVPFPTVPLDEMMSTTTTDTPLVDTTMPIESVDRFDENISNDGQSGEIILPEFETEATKDLPLKKTPVSPAEKTKSNRPAPSMEGQLFQDVAQKPAVHSMKGMNACPVKEEVVAPFWANNTRGEVLALLNLYPFEQYVHWEKCTHEHKQMFCREGCRCEQQFRLHRLLAYDPHNECRGIFSDWFRFPSCCICKCYDIPLEFRVTSRSPRSLEPANTKVVASAIDEAEAHVHRAIYEHATEDWYRPTINEDDDNDDDDALLDELED